jgi:hypothetical protein
MAPGLNYFGMVFKATTASFVVYYNSTALPTTPGVTLFGAGAGY